MPPCAARDIEAFGDILDLVRRSDTILACGPTLREAVSRWPQLYAGVARQGLDADYEAAALRAEAAALQQEFDRVAAPFLTLFGSVAPGSDKTTDAAIDALRLDIVTRIERLATVCWSYELRRARLEIDRIRAVYRATPVLASFDAKETEIHNRLAGDPVKAEAEIDALVAAVRPLEIAARQAAVAAYDSLARHLLERRALLAGSLKSLTRNLHEINSFLQSNIETARRLRAANYLLFADHLYALPAEEVRRIFGPDQTAVLLVGALDAFYLLPGPQDVMQLQAFTLTGAQES